MDPHEKAKRYTSLLHRYLSLIKQGDLETNSLMLTVPTPVNTVDQSSPSTQTLVVGVESDELFKEILKNVPSRNRKNVHYILDKMFQSKDIASWNESANLFQTAPLSVVPTYLIWLKVSQHHIWLMLDGDHWAGGIS